MRRNILLLATACMLCLGIASASAEEVRPPITPVQAYGAEPRDGWTAGKVVALGAGAIVGVMVANATLPVMWGMATPVIGAVVGATVGSWVHTKVTDSPMLRTRASMSAETPSLFHLASLQTAE